HPRRSLDGLGQVEGAHRVTSGPASVTVAGIQPVMRSALYQSYPTTNQRPSLPRMAGTGSSSRVPSRAVTRITDPGTVGRSGTVRRAGYSVRSKRSVSHAPPSHRTTHPPTHRALPEPL